MGNFTNFCICNEKNIIFQKSVVINVEQNENNVNNNKNDIKNNININMIKNNIKKNSEEKNNNMNNKEIIGQLSFTSVNSSEVDKEIGANSFLSDSSENNS